MTELRLQIPAKMRSFMEPYRHKVAHGGRGGAKSWSIAGMLLARGVAGPLRVLCAREIQKSIKDSVHQLLSDQVTALGLGDFYDVQATTIKGRNGSSFVYAGMQDHTAESVKSFEGVDIAWIEEAQSLSEQSAEILVPTIRKRGSELWWSYNPTRTEDYVHQRFVVNGDPQALVVEINWRDNPWFPVELEAERVRLKALNDDLYQHVWEGKCRSAAGVLFKREWFKRYDRLPERLNHYLASDYAVTQDGGDWTEHGVWGMDGVGDLYAVDWWSGQTDPDTWIQAWLTLVRRYDPLYAFEEKGVILRAVDAAINRAMKDAKVYTNRAPLASAGRKMDRALGFAARASAGTVWLPQGKWADRLLNQLCAFDGEDGHTDDMVDVCSLVARGLGKMADAMPQGKKDKGPPKVGTFAWLTQYEEKPVGPRIY